MYLNYSYHGKLLINNHYQKENLLIRFPDDNHIILQVLHIKIPKSGVSQLNIIGFVNLLDADTSTSNISICNYI